MIPSALRKSILRDIRATWGRFIAILAITALGAGFFAGLRATGPDMTATADDYFAGQKLADMRLVSTMGFTEEDIAALAALDGVDTVMASYGIDLLVEAEDGVSAVRLHAMPENREADNAGYLNQILLTEGRLPEAADECVADSQSHYKIGDTIVLSGTNDEDTLDLLAGRTLTVVGRADSPTYISFTRGNTNIGAGTLDAFLYLDTSAFDTEYYLEVWLALAGTEGLSAQSDAYKSLVDTALDELEAFGDVRAQVRYTEILEEANEKLADARQELADGRAEADEKLADALQELEDGEREIASAEKEIADNRKKLHDGEQQLADGEKELAEGRAALQSGQAQYDEGVAEYNAQKAQYDAGVAQFEAEKAAAEAGFSSMQGILDSLTQGNAALEAALQTMAIGTPAEQAAAAATFEATATGMVAGVRGLADALDASGMAAEAAGLRDAANMAEGFLAAGPSDYAFAYGVLSPIPGSMQPVLDNARAAADKEFADYAEVLAEGKRQLDEGWAVLEASGAQLAGGWAGIASGEAEIARNKEELEDGKRQLADGEKELADAKQELADGWMEYEDGKREAEEEIADGEQKIAEAQEELDDLEMPDWYVYSRDGNAGYEGLGSNIERISAIATVIPLFFFLVAALVCLTTMTRMVEEQRTTIGTLKALGFSKMAIAFKFLLYAGLASLIGSVVGVAIGYVLFPTVVWNAYRMMYIMPAITIAAQPVLILVSVLAMVLVTVLSTVAACLGELRSVPANLMRPKAPKAGTRVLLERIPFIWNHMKFSLKVTVRNLFRYKKRFFMTVIGVAGCTALLVTGFGLYDSINGIVAQQYGHISFYDAVVQLKDPGSALDDTELNRTLEELGSGLYVMETTVDVKGPAGGDGGMTTYLNVPEDPEALDSFIHFQERKSGAGIEWPQGDGVVVTEKLAGKLGVSEGGTITLGRSGEAQVEATVVGITENYVYHYIYMTPDTYTTLFGEAPKYERILLLTGEGVSESEAMSRLVALDAVAGGMGTSELKDEFSNMIQSLNSVVWLILLCAGLLAFVVLYNLTNINITERQREIATLKVLGFHRGEVAGYVYRENILLTVIGMLVGLVLGVFLHRYVITTAEIDEVMFGRVVLPLSYIWSMLFTLASAALVNIVMLRKLREIDMVESLKSAE